MSALLPVNDLLDAAEHKLGSALLCLNNAAKFSAASQEFGQWFSHHQPDLLALKSPDPEVKVRITAILKTLALLEQAAQRNTTIVGDLNTYINDKLGRNM
jgi:hypothetical protein